MPSSRTAGMNQGKEKKTHCFPPAQLLERHPLFWVVGSKQQKRYECPWKKPEDINQPSLSAVAVPGALSYYVQLADVAVVPERDQCLEMQMLVVLGRDWGSFRKRCGGKSHEIIGYIIR